MKLGIRQVLYDSRLCIYLDGGLYTETAPEFQIIMDGLDCKTFEKLVFDFEALKYISSIGIRIIIKTKKKYGDSFSIINANSEVYEVLELTGLTDIMKVGKAMKNIDVSSLEVIGTGGNGKIYRIDDDKIIKVYHSNIHVEEIEHERIYSQYCFTHNIPTAISYGLMQSNEGLGVVYELVHARTLAQTIMEEPEHYDALVDAYVLLAKTIHETIADKKVFPSMKDRFIALVDKLKDLYSESEIQIFHDIISSIPDADTLIHGDLHPKNIMMDGDELLLIDMADVSWGDRIFEFGANCLTMFLSAKTNPQTRIQFIGIDAETSLRVFHDFLMRYFSIDNEKGFDVIMDPVMKLGNLKAALAPAITSGIGEEMIRHLVQFGRINVLSHADEYIGKIELPK